MKAVGVKALKARLSEYLRQVKAGETILVTDREEVVAEIRPAHRQPVPPADLEEALRRMAEQGEATLCADPDTKWDPPPPAGGPLPISSRQLLDELRADRA